MLPNESPKNIEELQKSADKLKALFDTEVNQDWDTIEEPQILALLFAKYGYFGDTRNLLLESTQEIVVGMSIDKEIPRYLTLFDGLKAQGFGREHAVRMGGDALVYALEERSTPADDGPLPDILKELFSGMGGEMEDDSPRLVNIKTLVLETQSRHFIVVLNEQFSRWTVHIRRTYPRLEDELAQGGYLGTLDKIKDAANLTIHDVLRYAESAAEFADDAIPYGTQKRPSLQTFLAGNLIAGEEGAGVGLRYGDGRDAGYVVSLERSSDDLARAKDVHWGSYADIGYVVANLSSACDCFQDEHPTP